MKSLAVLLPLSVQRSDNRRINFDKRPKIIYNNLKATKKAGSVIMASQNDMRITVRVDKELKDSAEFLFEQLGLNMSAAINIFLRKAVSEDAIPFPVSTNSSGFGLGLSANYVTSAFNSAVRNDIRTNKNNGAPIAKYDAVKKQAYLEHADGTREYVNG